MSLWILHQESISGEEKKSCQTAMEVPGDQFQASAYVGFRLAQDGPIHQLSRGNLVFGFNFAFETPVLTIVPNQTH